MKKYTLFLVALAFILSSFSIYVNSASAQVSNVLGCSAGDKYSRTTGQPCANNPIHTDCAPGDVYSSKTGIKCTDTPAGAMPNIWGVFPVGCESGSVYNSLTGASCKEARFETKVYVYGSGFNSNAKILTYSTISGQRIFIPATFYSSEKLSFTVPSDAGSGLHSIEVYKLIGSDAFQSNAPTLKFIDPNPNEDFPPGCTSYSGYSSKTGMPCDGRFGAPTISGVKGPQSLNVNQTGTWTVSAYDKNGGDLTYGVVWGDEESFWAGSQSEAAISRQSATFTHRYSRAGNYKPTFVVGNRNGQHTETSLSVNVGNSTNPSITVLSPNGGETWAKGTTQTIKWQDTNDISTHEIKLVSYFPPPQPCTTKYCAMPIYAVQEYTLANTQGSSYNWTVGKSWENSNIPEGQYTIRVCQSGTSVCDSSDRYFTITSNATSDFFGTLTTIDGNTCSVGNLCNLTLKWTSNSSQNIVYINGGKSASLAGTSGIISLVNLFSGSTPYEVFPTEGKYTFCMKGITSSGIEKDMNPPACTVVTASNSNPIITVLSPNGGETWEKGTTQYIKWQYNGPVPSCMPDLPCIYPFKYDIYLYNDTYGDNLIAGSVSGSSYKWSVWPFRSDSERVKIKVCMAGSRTNCDSSDSSFKITSGTTTQQLTLSAERHSGSPAGYVFSGSNVELFRFNLSAKGRNAIVQKFNLEPVGPGIAHVSNIRAYVNGNYIGKLSDLTNTSSWYHKGVIDVTDANDLGGLGISQDNVVEISIRGDVSSSSAAINAWMWINLTGIRADPATPAASVSGLPVYGHQLNISSSTTETSTTGGGEGGGNAVYGAETFSFTQRLKRGSTGNEVMELQKLLNKLGYNVGNADGKFGLKTQTALIQFQTANKLKADGIAGVEVRTILNK